MADELQTSMTLAFTKGNDTLNFSVSDKTDVSGTPKLIATENFNATGANVSNAQIQAGGYGVTIVQNIGITKYVELSWDGTNYFCKLDHASSATAGDGEWCKVRPPHAGATELKIKAESGGTSDVAIWALSP